MVSSGTSCKECGAVIPADGPGGWCPQCLLSLGLDEVRSGEAPALHPGGVQGHQSAQPEPRVAAATPKFPPPLTDEPGDRIGRYRLLKEIGHGGYGVVFLAEQDEPVRRRVALKIIKLGMDTRQVVVRFEAERQALALMDHPNISKVLDAGATITGRPYFVMELVSGIRITDYCHQSDFTIRQRLDLFTQVCRAIQHAHQKGVIHRDIKPSNVLVTMQDGVPVPKVIDFGIAKATEGRLANDTVFTAAEHFIGTPAYMSPEQAKLGGLDVDTRSDIYSLGVLLYELLTGTPPFDPKELSAAGVDEMRRMIQHKEPPAPSIRLKQELTAAEAGNPRPSPAKEKQPQLSSQRILQLRQELQQLRGDLDWIVMKCLEKDRARRYETAIGLARDIDRYLNDEPVTARPPSRLYSFRKAVARNRTAFVSAAIVTLALLLGVVASIWQAVRATKAERRENLSLQEAKTAQTKVEKTLAMMQAIEIGRAEEFYDNGDRRNMLANLALVLRQNPTNRVAAERLMSALSHRVWARLACPPLLHTNRLTWAMFDRSGSRVLTTSADNTGQVWNPDSGERVGRAMIHTNEINNADFSGDGRLVVTASEDKNARVWDARTGNPITEPLRHATNVVLAKFSPSNDVVLTVSSNQAFLWSVESSTVKHLLVCPSVIEDACFSPDGSKVAIACSNGQAQVWATSSGLCLHPALQHGERVKSIAFSPDSKWLVTGSYDKTAQVWNVETGEKVGDPLEHKGTVLSAEFSPEGQRIVSTSADHSAQVWDVGTWKPIGPRLRHDADVRSAMFSPEGMRVVTTGNEIARVWEAFSGAALSEPMIHESGAYYAEFHPDGRRVVTVSNGKAALVWEVIGVPALTLFFSNSVESIEFSPDSKALAIASDGGNTRLWDPWTGKALTAALSEKANRRISRVVFSRDGSLVATIAPDDGLVRIWNAVDGQPVTTNLEHGIGVFQVCFSPDGTRLLTGSDHRSCVWDTTTWRLLLKLDVGCVPDALPFSANGEMFIGLPKPYVARIFSTRTGEPLSPELSHGATISSAMLSPDGQWLLTTQTGENSFVIWDVKAGNRLGSNFLHRGPPFAASYSPDGKRVLTLTKNFRAQVWNVDTTPSLTGEFGGHFFIRDGMFASDGARVVLTSLQGSAQLWDGGSGSRFSETFQSSRNTENVLCTRLSADGRLLAIGSADDNKVTIWEVSPVELPVPDWLPELAEALVGQRFNSQGALEFVPPEELWAIQQRLAEVSRKAEGNSFYTRWAKWFMADATSRTVLPSSSLTIPQYVKALLEQGTPEGCKQAFLLQPTNAIAMARVGGRAITNLALAEWMTERAVEAGPNLYETWIERANVLKKAGKMEEAHRALVQARKLKQR